MRGVLFFATKGDLYLNMKNIESNRAVKYIKDRIYDSEKYDIYYSVDELPRIGFHPSGEHTDESYLVLDHDTPLRSHIVEQQSGGFHYLIDQRENLDSIVFWPGGLFSENYLIHGRIATVYTHDKAKDLYKYFSKNLVRGFKKVREYYVGPEALGLSERVRMITINTKEPPEYDLHIEQYLK